MLETEEEFDQRNEVEITPEYFIRKGTGLNTGQGGGLYLNFNHLPNIVCIQGKAYLKTVHTRRYGTLDYTVYRHTTHENAVTRTAEKRQQVSDQQLC